MGRNALLLWEQWTNDHVSTALSAETYIKNFIPKITQLLAKEKLKGYGTPMSSFCQPEVDETEIIQDPDKAFLYGSIIGSLNWAITLGRFVIHYSTNSLSRYNISPREGHLSAVIRILGYL